VLLRLNSRITSNNSMDLKFSAVGPSFGYVWSGGCQNPSPSPYIYLKI